MTSAHACLAADRRSADLRSAAKHLIIVLLAGLVIPAQTARAQPLVKAPFRITIRDEKPTDPNLVFGIDPVHHVKLEGRGAMAYALRVDEQKLNLETMWNWMTIDNLVTWPGASGKQIVQDQPLPKKSGERPRIGHRSVWEHSGLYLTQEVEVVATRNKGGANRRVDAVVVRYVVENKDTKPHTLGIRAHLNDVLINSNRGLLFAAPNQPGKILDGVEVKSDKVPDYFQMLERPNLNDPGFVGHVTCNLGGGYDKVERIMFTRTSSVPGDKWDATVVQSGGHTGLVLYFDPKVIKPGGQRKMAYAFGQGIAPPIDGEGQVALRVGGSFEPGKLFTITAQVQDPAQGQHLTLELPPGMERVEGNQLQPVPNTNAEGNTLVVWKARVLQPGEYRLRLHSSTGVSLSKIITIARAQ